MATQQTIEPAEAELVHAFVNTLDLRSFQWHGSAHQGGDRIGTPAELASWLAERALTERAQADAEADPVVLTPAVLARAHELRAQLRTALAGRVPAAVPVQVRLDFTEDGPALAPTGTGVAAALGWIALAAARSATTGSWARLKVCAAPDCQWVFYDHSRPGRGRWCAPELCGNRMKTRAYRHRH